MLKHLISTSQFNEPKDLERIFTHADLMANPYNKSTVDLFYMLRGKLLGLLFFEKSTRTKIGFDVAIKKLGGDSVYFDPDQSSLIKGESIQDTAKILSQFVSALVVRERNHEILKQIASISEVPVINAGSSEHPVQALSDIHFIKKEKHDNVVHGSSILLFGDLRYSRVIHSLLSLLRLYKHIRVHCYSIPELKLPPEYYYDNIIYTEVENEKQLMDVISKVDVVYISRNQQELFQEKMKLDLNKPCIFNQNYLNCANEKCLIMHPGPRTDELSSAMDSDRRITYFRQAKNGLYIKMALLHEILSDKDMP